MYGKMLFRLIECLAAYKFKMEYQNISEQSLYERKSKIRREMAKLYGDVFGPVCHLDIKGKKPRTNRILGKKLRKKVNILDNRLLKQK